MTTALVLHRRPELRVEVPGQPPPWCETEGCERTARWHVVWITRGWAALSTNDVCVWHEFRLRPHGGLWFPLGHRPAIGPILAAVNAEIIRRRQAQQPRVYGFGGTTTGYSFNWSAWS